MHESAEPEAVESVLPLPPMQPVQLGERIEAIDILRGFALLGILSVNMQFYTTPFMAFVTQQEFWPDGHDKAATFFIKLFTESKFYILFSFLFGLGITIQLLRAKERGAGFAGRHVRRMFILLGFGLIHAYFLWMGDILTTYAILGLCFTALTFLPARVLMLVAAVIYGLALLMQVGLVSLDALATSMGKGGSDPGEMFRKFGLPDAAEAVRIYGSGSFAEIMRLRAMEVLITYPFAFVQMGPIVVAMFTLGCVAGKLRVFEDLPEWLPFFRRWRWPALVIGLLGNLSYAAAAVWLHSKGLQFKLSAVVGLGIGAPALTFFYVSVLVELSSREIGQRLLRPIALVGRMALTNYLLQSAICTTIFYSYGGGLYASIGPLGGLGLTLVIYAAQIPFSVVWLSRFQYGPMEWLWRTLTYGKFQPMRIQ
jgi:uncharacterized protein